MAKLTGNLQIKLCPGKEGEQPYFEVVFVPYAGRLNTKPAKVNNLDDLVALLTELKLSEDEAQKWAGRSRSQGVVIIPSFERTDSLLKEMGLLV
ncbi:MAG: hypothetical protein P4L26_06955 [Terracidiphilus sp.]|nr:hypothetical protein [Terracidiphilus sp.]